MPTKHAIITTRKEAVSVVREFRTLEEEIIAIEQEHDIPAKRRKVAELRQSVVSYMGREAKSQLDIGEAHVTLVEPSRKTWIGTKEDIPLDMPTAAKRKVKSLRAILGRELWMRVSKRVVDPRKLEELIEEGEITEKQVAPAFVELPTAPYIRYYEGK